MSATSPFGVRRTLHRLGLSPRKVLGQHFLTHRGVLMAILRAAQVSPHDVVVEIGPGLGVLTREVIKRVFPAGAIIAHEGQEGAGGGQISLQAESREHGQDGGRVIAVEMDQELSAALSADLGPLATVVTADARRVDIPWLVGGHPGYKVLGNLPYYAATAILRRFLEAPCKPALAVVMVQREVAQQMVAAPGEMSLLSVAVQLYGKPTIVRSVPPAAFYPPPQVTSAVVRIEVYPRPALALEDVDSFFATVRAGFCAPRKQLRNALAQGIRVAGPKAEELLRVAGIDPVRRAETLALEEWGRLHQVVATNHEPH